MHSNVKRPLAFDDKDIDLSCRQKGVAWLLVFLFILANKKIILLYEWVQHLFGWQWQNYCIIIVSNIYRPQRSCGKVIFSQASVSHSVHRGKGVSGRHPPGGQAAPPASRPPPPAGRHLPGRHLPGQTIPGADTPLPSACFYTHTPAQYMLLYTHPHPSGHCSGWYASYWNAFLFGLLNLS